MIDLQGLRVLVTRPAPQGEALCELITQHHGQPFFFPTIQFISHHNEPHFLQSLQTLSAQQWLIFVSPQAVKSSITQLKKIYPHMLFKIAAIGKSTAQALQAEQVPVLLFPQTESSSEALLAEKALQQLAGQQVALIKGKGGRTLLQEVLTMRGAQVQEIIAYERTLPHVDVMPYVDLLQKQAIDLIVAASYETLFNLKQLLPAAVWPFLLTTPVLTVSERIKRLAADLDFQSIWITQGAQNPVILQGINQFVQKK